MGLKLWQVDAFAGRVFEGNPAAVVPLSAWLSDITLQAIAEENNLAETAYFIEREPGRYALRWFTPSCEVPLCGHATLASAFVIFSDLAPRLTRVSFETKSGTLNVTRGEDGVNAMEFPAGVTKIYSGEAALARDLGTAMGSTAPQELYLAPTGGGGMPGLFAVWKNEDEIRALQLSSALPGVLKRAGSFALLATAQGETHDFVSRFFAPDLGIPEDPVTGSAHCTLTPFWARRLEKKILRARQISARGGELLCTDEGARVILAGQCALYMTATIKVPD
jgi:PhzF family phenazine biosynthesis protein